MELCRFSQLMQLVSRLVRLRLTEIDLSFAKTPSPFDFNVPQELTKKSILYNREQTLVPSRYSLEMLRTHSFSGASMAKGRTGSREFFVGSNGRDPASPPQARSPVG